MQGAKKKARPRKPAARGEPGVRARLDGRGRPSLHRLIEHAVTWRRAHSAWGATYRRVASLACCNLFLRPQPSSALAGALESALHMARRGAAGNIVERKHFRKTEVGGEVRLESLMDRVQVGESEVP